MLTHVAPALCVDIGRSAPYITWKQLEDKWRKHSIPAALSAAGASTPHTRRAPAEYKEQQTPLRPPLQCDSGIGSLSQGRQDNVPGCRPASLRRSEPEGEPHGGEKGVTGARGHGGRGRAHAAAAPEVWERVHPWCEVDWRRWRPTLPFQGPHIYMWGLDYEDEFPALLIFYEADIAVGYNSNPAEQGFSLRTRIKDRKWRLSKVVLERWMSIVWNGPPLDYADPLLEEAVALFMADLRRYEGTGRTAGDRKRSLLYADDEGDKMLPEVRDILQNNFVKSLLTIEPSSKGSKADAIDPKAAPKCTSGHLCIASSCRK
eukprot:gene57345-biopygen81107